MRHCCIRYCELPAHTKWRHRVVHATQGCTRRRNTLYSFKYQLHSHPPRIAYQRTFTHAWHETCAPVLCRASRCHQDGPLDQEICQVIRTTSGSCHGQDSSCLRWRQLPAFTRAIHTHQWEVVGRPPSGKCGSFFASLTKSSSKPRISMQASTDSRRRSSSWSRGRARAASCIAH